MHAVEGDALIRLGMSVLLQVPSRDIQWSRFLDAAVQWQSRKGTSPSTLSVEAKSAIGVSLKLQKLRDGHGWNSGNETYILELQFMIS
jgi:hypothetical protein